MGSSTACQSGVGEEPSDYVLAGGTGLPAITKQVEPKHFPTPFAYTVLSPVFPPPDGIQSGFNGDYSGLTLNTGTEAHPIWSDTRNASPFPGTMVAHDEDVFSDTTALPSGTPSKGPGTIGH